MQRLKKQTEFIRMTKQLLLSILTTFLVATEIYGQTESILKKNEIGLGIGLYQATIKNVLVSDSVMVTFKILKTYDDPTKDEPKCQMLHLNEDWIEIKKIE